MQYKFVKAVTVEVVDGTNRAFADGDVMDESTVKPGVLKSLKRGKYVVDYYPPPKEEPKELPDVKPAPFSGFIEHESPTEGKKPASHHQKKK